MTREERDTLSPRYMAVWAAAYAAAWERTFDRCRGMNGFNHLSVDPNFEPRPRLREGFSHAEEAEEIADLAVLDLQRWERENR